MKYMIITKKILLFFPLVILGALCYGVNYVNTTLLKKVVKWLEKQVLD